MDSHLSLCLLSLILFFSISSAARHNFLHPLRRPSVGSVPPEIDNACKATRFPEECKSSMANKSHVTTPIEIVKSAAWVSAENIRTAQSMIQSILDSSKENLNRTNAAKNCVETLLHSDYRLNLTADALSRAKNKDARAWLSAGLAYQFDCWSTMKYVNDTPMVDKTMSFLNSLTHLTSNALNMLRAYDMHENKLDQWVPPKTERDGLWENVGGSKSGSVVFPDLKPDVTVCKSGCNHKTVQEAVDAAPKNSDKRFVISIKEGVYDETVRVALEKKNVVFLGDGMGKTVITGSLNVGQPGVSTYTSATVGVVGDGFMAKGLTIQNTAGPVAHQAVAFRSDSDLSIIENCEFLGNQDTLYAHSLRQLYRSCRIEGNVDFIFGNAAAIFQDCDIRVRPRQQTPEKGENNAVTAHARHDPAQSTGFVFQNCSISGTEEYTSLYKSNPSIHKNYLGRPWKEYSRTVFINCNMEAIITPEGWMPWDGDFALKTLYYGEFGSKGPGANPSARVAWSNKIPAEHIDTYSVQNFIQGDEFVK